MPRRNNREYRMDPRELQFIKDAKRREEAVPSGKPVNRKKQAKRRYQETQ